MTGVLLTFPRRPRTADTFQVQFDFGAWSIAYFRRQRFCWREGFASGCEAFDKADSLALLGLRRLQTRTSSTKEASL